MVGEPVLFMNDNWNLLMPMLDGLLFVVYVASTAPPTTLNSYSVAPVTDVEYKFVLAWEIVAPHWDPMISGWVDPSVTTHGSPHGPKAAPHWVATLTLIVYVDPYTTGYPRLTRSLNLKSVPVVDNGDEELSTVPPAPMTSRWYVVA